jgi:hypothetical protein
MKILPASLLAAGLMLSACRARADLTKDEGFGDLTVDQVADLIASKDADLFDNNGKDVYAKGHVPSAKWVAFNAVQESDLPKDKSRKLIFYCANTH